MDLRKSDAQPLVASAIAKPWGNAEHVHASSWLMSTSHHVISHIIKAMAVAVAGSIRIQISSNECDCLCGTCACESV